jgi:hypothetical protein
VHAKQAAAARRAARRIPTALVVLWTVWGAVAAVNLVVWVLVSMSTGGDLYPWPAWMLVPGAALATAHVGTQVIRSRDRT